MKILGIETSCDETAAAVVENGVKILSSAVASSAEMHAKTGGVIPEAAARAQVVSILPVLQEALSDAKCGMEKIDAIATTVGPGLVGSLLVGVESAKTLAYLYRKPIVPVNHLVAHIYANWLVESAPEFPAMVLVVSGGHTDLVLMQAHSTLEWLGGTRDDAAGEAFDKSARLLGLSYPGGPAIAAAAKDFKFPNSNFQLKLFPRPMMDEHNFDFSFSGLKTAVWRATQDKGLKISTEQLAAEVQEAIVDVLITKTLRAVREFRPKSLLLAGGVSANTRLREAFESKIKNLKLEVDFRVPPPKLCTDNAAYIAACAYFCHFPVAWESLETKPDLSISGQV